MRRVVLGAVVFALFAAACVFAQRRPGPFSVEETWAQRRTRELAHRLELTDAQRQQALALFTAADKSSEPIDEKLAQARRLLREATRKNTPDAEIDKLSSTIGTLTGQLEAIQAKTGAAFYRLLTAEQREKLDRRPGPPPGQPRGKGRH